MCSESRTQLQRPETCCAAYEEEQDTAEAVAVGGVREVRGEEPGEDWDLDDDAADYSAAV